jgi:hypothetical protein
LIGEPDSKEDSWVLSGGKRMDETDQVVPSEDADDDKVSIS